MSYIPEQNSQFDFFINQSRPKSMFGTQQSYKVLHQYGHPVEHFLNLDNRYQESLVQQNERMPEDTIKEMQRMKNRIKAKRFRDKKKVVNELAFTKMKQLESENYFLKQSKTFCGRCKTKVIKKASFTTIEQHPQKHQLQFQAPKLEVEKHQNGKIWIALGIIMLIIGVNIHGFNKQPIEINLPPSFVNKIQKQLQSGSDNIKVPFSIRENNDVFKESYHPDRKVNPPKTEPILLIEGQGEQFKSKQMVEINKDFIMRLHGEINEIGNYL